MKNTDNFIQKSNHQKPVMRPCHESWADKVSATDSPREENGCNYSGKNSKKENKTG